MKNSEVLVLLPCLNESFALGHTIDGIERAIPGAQIIVIDNGSTDDSVEIARQKRVNLVHEPRRGKGNAFRRGLLEVSKETKAVFLVDSDDTYGLDKLAEAINAVESEGYDMVVGNRVISGETSNSRTTAFRQGHKLGNFLLSKFGQLIHPAGIQDTLSGWRVFSPRFLKSFSGGSSGFEIEAELNAHAYLLGSAVKNFDVSYKGRIEGTFSKLNTYQDGLRILRLSLKSFRNDRPQLAFSIFSIPWLIASISFNFRAVGGYLETGLVAQFPSLFAGIGAFLAWILLVITGMILERIKQLRVNLIRQSYNNPL
jgi:glycosyltransferase involved in cell wall biosynthesis